MKKTIKVGALVTGAALVLAACGSAPDSDADTGTPAPTDTATMDTGNGDAVDDFLPCIVSDGGGFNDRSFNQSGLEGLQQAAQSLGGIRYIQIQSQSETDFAPNIQSAIDQDCDFIITIGFQLSAATIEAAQANPDVQFAIVDYAAENEDGSPIADNLKSLVFNTAEAAFLAGYLSAGVTETGIVGTFGGMAFPTVTVFMDGFLQGVNHFNEQEGTDVRVVGWDGSDGSFTGGFQANEEARTTAQNIIDQGVDVLLPVGGPIYQSAMAAINDSGREILLIGVDQDFFYSDPTTADILLTSVLKEITVAVNDAVIGAAQGEFAATAYIGTLENGGVGLAPFHNLADRVPAELQDRIAQLTQDIIDGTVVVHSYLD